MFKKEIVIDAFFGRVASLILTAKELEESAVLDGDHQEAVRWSNIYKELMALKNKEAE